MNPNLGYACICLSLKDKGITTNRGMIKKTFQSKGIEYASELALLNVQDLYTIAKWNLDNNINVFRMTSELFPWASEYRLQDLPHYSDIVYWLERCGKLPIRYSFHPGPFNKLAGEGSVLTNTIKDLEHHSEVMDLMNLPTSNLAKINVHVGGAYGDKSATLKKFATNFKKLSSNLRSRLTVENDDKAGLYSVIELIPLIEEIEIPICFDYFHHSIYNGGLSEQDAFELSLTTWNVKPAFHYSSSRRIEEPAAKEQAHADYIYEQINTYGFDIDVVLEAKQKDFALLGYRREFMNGQSQMRYN